MRKPDFVACCPDEKKWALSYLLSAHQRFWRLIGVFAWRTLILLFLSGHGSIGRWSKQSLVVEEVYRHLRFVEEVVVEVVFKFEVVFQKGKVSILFVRNSVLPFLPSLFSQNEMIKCTWLVWNLLLLAGETGHNFFFAKHKSVLVQKYLL